MNAMTWWPAACADPNTADLSVKVPALWQKDSKTLQNITIAMSFPVSLTAE